jgi:hypothetical protein
LPSLQTSRTRDTSLDSPAVRPDRTDWRLSCGLKARLLQSLRRLLTMFYKKGHQCLVEFFWVFNRCCMM